MMMGNALRTLSCCLLLACLAVGKVEVVYPRSGDTYYPTHCSSKDADACHYSVTLTIIIHSHPAANFTMDISHAGESFIHHLQPHQPLLSRAVLTLSLSPPPSTASLALTCTVSEGGKIVFEDDFDVVFLRNEDLPGHLGSGCPNLACSEADGGPDPVSGPGADPGCGHLDYLEIGTSNFDTAAHQAEILIKQHPDVRLRGISVEPVRNYLDQLPVLADSCKIHAAVKASHEPVAVDHIYFIPESIIDKTGMPQYLKGCSTMSRPGDMMISNIVVANLSTSIIQRQPIPMLGPDQLLKYAPHGLKLLKTDVEGMDTKVMQSVLGFYEARALSTGSLVADGSWPCVLMFETIIFAGTIRNVRDPLLLHRLKALGYILLNEQPGVDWNGFDGVGESPNTAAVNCACPLKDIEFANVLGQIVKNKSDFFQAMCTRL